jgi:HEAT repeat protein
MGIFGRSSDKLSPKDIESYKNKSKPKPLVAALGSDDPDVRRLASEALVQLGSVAAEELCFALKDEKLRKPAQDALVAMGVPAVESLLSRLTFGGEVVKETLALLGDTAVESLTSHLANSAHGGEAAIVLWKIATPLASSALLSYLPSLLEELTTRYARKLFQPGSSSKSELFSALEDKNKREKFTLFGMICRLIDGAHDPDGSILGTLLAAVDRSLRPNFGLSETKMFKDSVLYPALKALGKFDDSRAVNALGENLRDEDVLLRVAASNALVEIGAPAVPTLQEALNDPVSQVYASIALQKLSEKGTIAGS